MQIHYQLPIHYFYLESLPKKKKKMERKPQVNRGDEAYKLLSDIKIPIEKKMISYVIYSENLFSRIVLF